MPNFKSDDAENMHVKEVFEKHHKHHKRKERPTPLSLETAKALNQGLFCFDQVNSGKFLAFFNLRPYLQMVLDIMDLLTENMNSSKQQNILLMRFQICGKMA